jgi:hypothetical protein
MSDTITTSALCGSGRHQPCEDRRLFTTSTCQCSCHVHLRNARTAPLLLVLPATFHPLRGYLAHRESDTVHTLVGCAPTRLEAICDGTGWIMFGDVDLDDRSLPPNGYARRLLDALGIHRARYLGGTCVIAGADDAGALRDVPIEIVNKARDLALIIKAGATS